MTSNQYQHVPGKSPNVSPDKRQRLNFSSYLPMPDTVQSITKGQGKEITLGIEWFQELNFKKDSQKCQAKLKSLNDYIRDKDDGTVSLYVSFDAFGIYDQKSYYENKSSTNLKYTLKKLKYINYKLTLQEIRKEEAKKPKNPDIQLKKLKFFKFSFLKWGFSPEQQIRIIRETVFTQRISISLAGTFISDNLIQELYKLLTNTLGLFQEIELNLQKCPGVNYLMLKKLMNITFHHPPQILKLRFVGWGQDLNKYFFPQNKNRHKQLIQECKNEIEGMIKKLKYSRFEVLLDFRNWHEDFELKKLQLQTNADKANEQSYGLYSISKNINKPKYNLVFLA